MKPYGHTRFDGLVCPYGCCHSGKTSKVLHCREAADRARRKKARQEAKRFVCEED